MQDQAFDFRPVHQYLAFKPVARHRAKRKVVMRGQLAPQETGGGGGNANGDHEPLELRGVDPPAPLGQPMMTKPRKGDGREEQGD